MSITKHVTYKKLLLMTFGTTLVFKMFEYRGVREGGGGDHLEVLVVDGMILK